MLAFSSFLLIKIIKALETVKKKKRNWQLTQKFAKYHKKPHEFVYIIIIYFRDRKGEGEKHQ